MLTELVEALIVFRVCKSLCCSKSVKLVEAKKLRTDLSNKVLLEELSKEAVLNFLEFDEYKEVLKGILRRKYDWSRVNFKLEVSAVFIGCWEDFMSTELVINWLGS